MKSAFTLIELLVVIAILGILAAAVLVAINPGKRTAQARDAARKNDVTAIANALVGYFALVGEYPKERPCDTSRGNLVGGSVDMDCSTIVGSDWVQVDASNALIYQRLVTDQGFLKQLPKDTVNNTEFYYRYEPSANGSDTCTPAGFVCARYWIGARLEAVDDSAQKDRLVFRCSDYASSTHYNGGAGYQAGCREVLFDNASYVLDGDGFDNALPTDGLP